MGHLFTVAIGQFNVYPNREIRARITAMYQIIQEVSTEIASCKVVHTYGYSFLSFTLNRVGCI